MHMSTHGWLEMIHWLCFISNTYKQRFYPLVKFLKKISNTTSLFQITKQNYQKIKQQKLVELNFCLSSSQSQFIYHVLKVLNTIWIKIHQRKTVMKQMLKKKLFFCFVIMLRYHISFCNSIIQGTNNSHICQIGFDFWIWHTFHSRPKKLNLKWCKLVLILEGCKKCYTHYVLYATILPTSWISEKNKQHH